MTSLKNLYEMFLKKYYIKTPKTIKKILSPILFFIKFRILARIKHIYPQVYLLKGKEKSKKSDLKVLFLGSKISLYYLSYILFSEEPELKYVGKTSIWGSKKFIQQFYHDVDATFIETDRFFSGHLKKNDFIIFPAWVEVKLDTSQPFENIYKNFKNSAKKDIRIIGKNDYSYEITKDSEKFEFFYHKIRLPYLSERLGKLTLPDTTNYEETRDIFDRGRLLLAKEKEDYVSGFFLVNYGKSAHACYMGILNPSYYLPRGAGTALYYFSILWAKKNNIDILDFGNNRSFLNDGSFQYKRKWGGKVSISKRFFGVYGFKICNFKSKAVQDFLKYNPFTFIDKKQLNGIIFLQNQISPEDANKILDKYYTLGMAQLYIVPPQKDLENLIKTLLHGDIVYKEKKLKDFDEQLDSLSDKILIYNEEKFQPFNIDYNHITDNLDTPDNNLIERQGLLMKSYDIDAEKAKQILSSKYDEKFEKFVKQFPGLKNEIFGTFLHTYAMFKREGLDLKKIDDELLETVFSALSENKFSKEATPDILRYLVKHDTRDINEALKTYGFYIVDEKEIRKVVEKVVAERTESIKKRGFSARDHLMGIIMKELHGKADGQIVSKILNEKIEEVISLK